MKTKSKKYPSTQLVWWVCNLCECEIQAELKENRLVLVASVQQNERGNVYARVAEPTPAGPRRRWRLKRRPRQLLVRRWASAGRPASREPAAYRTSARTDSTRSPCIADPWRSGRSPKARSAATRAGAAPAPPGPRTEQIVSLRFAALHRNNKSPRKMFKYRSPALINRRSLQWVSSA